jgi:hypothetical protein
MISQCRTRFHVGSLGAGCPVDLLCLSTATTPSIGCSRPTRCCLPSPVACIPKRVRSRRNTVARHHDQAQISGNHWPRYSNDGKADWLETIPFNLGAPLRWLRSSKAELSAVTSLTSPPRRTLRSSSILTGRHRAIMRRCCKNERRGPEPAARWPRSDSRKPAGAPGSRPAHLAGAVPSLIRAASLARSPAMHHIPASRVVAERPPVRRLTSGGSRQQRGSTGLWSSLGWRSRRAISPREQSQAA